MKQIARRKVIVYTPRNWDENGDNISNAWGLGHNDLQKHQCLVPIELLNNLGYKTQITEIDGNILGVYPN